MPQGLDWHQNMPEGSHFTGIQWKNSVERFGSLTVSQFSFLSLKYASNQINECQMQKCAYALGWSVRLSSLCPVMLQEIKGIKWLCENQIQHILLLLNIWSLTNTQESGTQMFNVQVVNNTNKISALRKFIFWWG